MPDARVSILIDAQDRANGVLERLRSNLGGVSGRGGIVGAATSATKALSGIGFAVFGIQQLGHAVSGLADGFFGFNSSLEQATITYSTLLGSADAAQRRIAELQQFAALTPFNFDQVLEADRLLETFGARSIDTLTLVGDAAAGTSQNFNEVAFWIGRAYSAIQAGQPFGEAAMRLQEMGILTADGRSELEKLTDAGASSEEVWGVLTKQMGRFSGLMEKQSRSGKGLTSTLKDLFTMGKATIMAPIYDVYLRGLKKIVDYISSAKVQTAIFDFAHKIRDLTDLLFGSGDREGLKHEGIIPREIERIKQAFRNWGGMNKLLPILAAAWDGFIGALKNVWFWATWLWERGLKPLVEWLHDLLKGVREFTGDPSVTKMAALLGAVAGYALAARVALTGLSLILGPLAPLLSAAGLGMKGLGMGVQAIALFGDSAIALISLLLKPLAGLAAIPLAPVAASLSLIAEVLIGFATMNPVALTLAAIAAAIMLWDKVDWKGIGGGIVDLASAIKDGLVDAIGKLAGVASDPASLAGAIGQVVYDAIYGLANLPSYVIESLSKLAQNLLLKLADRIKALPIKDIKDAIGTALGAVLEALSQAPGLFAKAASALGSVLLTAITNFPGAAGKIASGIGSALSALAEALPGFVVQAAKDVGNTILNYLTAPLGNFAEPARQYIKTGLMALLDAASVIYGVAKSVGGRIISAIADGFSLVVNLPVRLATFLIGQIASLLGAAGNLIVATARAIGSRIGDWIADGLAASASFVGRLVEIIKDALADAWSLVPKPWDLFGLGASSSSTPSLGSGGGGGGMPVVVQVVFGGPTLATEAEMTRAVRIMVPALRREFDRLYA